MPAFRRRKQVVCGGGSPLHTYRVINNGDNVIVTPSLSHDVKKELYPEAPSLDELINSGVGVKEVRTDGILDSYDANDIPNLDNVIEDCINDVKKAKSKPKKEK